MLEAEAEAEAEFPSRNEESRVMGNLLQMILLRVFLPSFMTTWFYCLEVGGWKAYR